MKKKIHVHRKVGPVIKMICGARGGLTDIRNTSKVTCKRCKKIIRSLNFFVEVPPPDPKQLDFER